MTNGKELILGILEVTIKIKQITQLFFRREHLQVVQKTQMIFTLQAKKQGIGDNLSAMR